MKLIHIYGAPAVGKLTVAKELQKITGYKIFHNHTVLDMIDTVVENDDDKYWNLAKKIRLDILEFAAKQNSENIIKTECYSDKDNRNYIRKQIRLINKHKGKVCFVYLKASMKTLEKRVTDKSRKKYNKLKSVQKLRKSMKKHGLDNKIPFVDSLEIDTEKYSAKQAAKIIVKHYKLKKHL